MVKEDAALFRTGSLKLSWGLLLFAAVFLFVYQPWSIGERELQRAEGLIVAEALEYQPVKFVLSAHGMNIPGAYPLYPALGYAVQKIHRKIRQEVVPRFSIPTRNDSFSELRRKDKKVQKALMVLENVQKQITMPMIMRFISLTALALTAVVVGIAAASVRDRRAGWVAAAVYLTTLIAIEKSCEGMPATLAALPVLLGQLLFFHFGFRKNRWNTAWIAALAFAALAFLVDGFQTLFYFFFPFCFFRRPLSVRAKFHYPGFWAGALLLGSIIAFYLEVSHLHAGEMYSLRLFWNDFSLGSYLLTLLSFPFRLALRLFPWTLIAWFPFCVALQALDATPIYGRYLRTLSLSTLALLWLHPDIDPRNLFYLLGPLAIQIGMYYELGVRRYGHRLMKTGPLLELFAFLAILLFIGALILPPNLLDYLAGKFSASYGFGFLRDGRSFYPYIAGIAVLMAASVLIFLLWLDQLPAGYGAFGGTVSDALQRLRRKVPVGYDAFWGMLLAAAVCCGLINSLLIRPYRAQDHTRQNFAVQLNRALKEKPDTLYKLNIVGLYAELYYAGIPKIRDIDSVDKLPLLRTGRTAREQKTVYLLSAAFPEQISREWVKLGDFVHHGTRFSLWKGSPRKEMVEYERPEAQKNTKGEQDE